MQRRSNGCVTNSDVPENIQRIIYRSLRKVGLCPQRLEKIEEGVSGAIKVVAFLGENGFDFERVVIKYGQGVGIRERQGARLLEGYLNTPPALLLEENYPFAEDIHIYQFIAGPTLDFLIANRAREGKRKMGEVLEAHVRMWENTLTDNSRVMGYPKKIEDTKRKLFYNPETGKERKIVLNNEKRALIEIADLPIVFNGKKLPSLNFLFEIVAWQIQESCFYALLHGDEGAGNFIVARNGTIYTIDNERVGIHCIEEGVAKFLCWFPAIHSNGEKVVFEVRNNRLYIDFKIDISNYLRNIVQEMRNNLENLLVKSGLLLDRKRLHAFCAFYYWRELQWLLRRGRHYMKPYILCLAIQEAGRCWKIGK